MKLKLLLLLLVFLCTFIIPAQLSKHDNHPRNKHGKKDQKEKSGERHGFKFGKRRGRVEDLLADYDDDSSDDEDDEDRGEWLFQLQDVRGSCKPNPCLNNGVCEEKKGRYKCKCPKTFRGRRCEKSKKICKKDMCGYGQCVLTTSPPFFECKCKAPFVPPNCKRIAPCEWNPCVNGGTCQKDGQNFDCVCLPGFSGKFCQVGPLDCYEGNGESYRGRVSETEDGDECLFWNSYLLLGKGTSPFTTANDPQGLGPHNYCRNPDGDSKPWCFTRSGKKIKWDHCDVRKCPTDAITNDRLKPKPTAHPAAIPPAIKPIKPDSSEIHIPGIPPLGSDAAGGHKPGSDAVGGHEPGSDAVGGPEPGPDTVGGPEPGTDTAGGPEPGTDSAGGPEPGIDTAGGPEPGTDTAGGPEPGTDTAGGPEPGTDTAGGPEPGTDTAGGPEPGTDTAGGPEPGTDTAGGPEPGTDTAGGPEPGTDTAGGSTPESNTTGSLIPIDDTNGEPSPPTEETHTPDIHTQGVTEKPTIVPPVRQFETCGKPQPKRPISRIYGGIKALPGGQPWQASIQVRSKDTTLPFRHVCGGTLIKPCWVLTAGHCIDSKKDFQVVLGSINLAKPEPSHQTLEVVETIIHEQYRETPESVYNDIALLKLKAKNGKCAEENQFVKTACLPTVNFPDGTECSISGWGATESQYSSSQLLDADVLLISQDTCSSNKVYGKVIDNNMFCAGYLEGGVDSCQGDSGGPLVCVENQVHYIYGIVSWGDNCGLQNKPGVYTRVTNFVDWINRKTAAAGV
ncbi:hyaluronan-binding protein 2-like isoform X2 [Hemibagrus wyckioides]|uniref:hyaluronan-binding protein 2-like isoform X2 n=1 Tax=Hemibagrus wyckioides TaxID=337641 RepID=UPI00266BCDE9|nr:hyaluronan-binding protein 2-like isoform X2 [Hemibagrus wyckioides]